ncbi:disease resistance protein SUMM2-like [Canna indica]|uniref:Disease resistance protein SUMM2-like n=1 Tax=Canna indica TaxID=4628 RepID=A0AAQ3KV85_9LILI|nr:disease resistance protein SUMM2-like [Canna indica]
MVCPGLNQCVGGIGSGIGNDILKFAWKKFKLHPSYVIYYKKKYKELKEQFDILKSKRDDIQLSVEAAERNNEVIGQEVTLWLNEASQREEKLNDIEKKFNEIDNQLGENNRCFKRSIPNLVPRYKVGREATKEKATVVELLGRINFQFLSQPPNPATMESPPMGDFRAFGSTRDAMNKVMKALGDENVHLIGIYGMGGVGKTTLMEEIGRKVKKEKMFDLVIEVVVSQNPSIDQIRREIADELGLRESGAKNLATRLNKENKIMIMLDDIWSRIDLKDLGIPYGEERKGCKIILTSRTSEVCDLMETDASVEVAVLSEQDSWELFKSKSGKVVESPDIEPFARKVAQECGGLPLAIVVVGRALRTYHDRESWRDALAQLKRSMGTHLAGVEDRLFKSLELSYKQLKNEELKVLFLYCCLFREDYDISEDEVVRYAVGENLISNVETLEEVRGRIHFLLEKLKASCLLIKSKKMGCVKLHDVVRDVAVYIASKDENHFLVKAGLGMRDWPEGENLEVCKRISLVNNEMLEIPDGSPNCSRLVLLLLNLNPITSIPGNFFENMKALNVLDLSGTDIESLPLSLECLKNLGTLRLDNCRKLRGIDVVGELKSLKILTLQYCILICALPSKIDTLVKLKLLDFSNCESLKLPEGLLCMLTRLEELYMKGYNVTEPLLAEVASLGRLVRVELYVKNAQDFSQHVFPSYAFKELHHFIIYNEVDWYALTGAYLTNLLLEGVSQSVIKWAMPFLRKTEHLMLVNFQCSSTELTPLDEESCFPNLKKLYIVNCNQIKYLHRSTEDTPANTFGALENIQLSNLENLERIFQGQLPTHSFGRLRMMDLTRCKNMTEILPQDFLQRVHSSLEELALNGCPGPKVLLNLEGFAHGSIILPKLHGVRLFNVSNLMSFCTPVVRDGSLGNLTTIEVTNCTKLSCLFSHTSNFGHSRLLPLGTLTKLKTLKLSKCQGLTYVFLPSIVKELQSLENLEISTNSSMEAIIDEETDVLLEEGIFPMLKQLLLVDLTELSCFYKGEPQAISFNWPSLEYTQLRGCHNLMRLPFGVQSARNLKKVLVGHGEVEWFKGLEQKDNSFTSHFEVIEAETEDN